ncbi:MAG: hypothetical protein WC545_00980 [Patescibacteria group bacterium]
MPLEKPYFWPEWFAAGLNASEKKKINPELILKLNRANLYLWRALNIYDDFLDGTGQAARLPIANRYYRHFLESYYRLNLKSDFYRLLNKILNDLDAANRAEAALEKIKTKNGKIIIPSRLPLFEPLSLSRKSLALGLGPIALLSTLGYPAKSEKIKNTLKFFRAALAAKQLADDAADWFEDLKNGALSAANVLVLRAAKRDGLTLKPESEPEILYLLFATKASGKLAADISRLCRRARALADTIGLRTNNRLLREIILPLEDAIKESERFRKEFFGDDISIPC